MARAVEQVLPEGGTVIFCKVDVNFYAHHKFRAVGLDGQGLWLAGLAYARQLETSGFVPDAAMPMFGGSDAVSAAALKLTDVGLWIREDTGFRIHNYAGKGNQTKEDVNRSKEAAKARKAAFVERKRNSVPPSNWNGAPPDEGNTVPTSPEERVTAGSVSDSVSLSDQDLSEPEIANGVPNQGIPGADRSLAAAILAYESGVSAGRRMPFGVPRAQWDDLRDVMRVHGRDGDGPYTGATLSEWLETDSRAFATWLAAMPPKAQDAGKWNFNPRAFGRWLNDHAQQFEAEAAGESVTQIKTKPPGRPPDAPVTMATTLASFRKVGGPP